MSLLNQICTGVFSLSWQWSQSKKTQTFHAPTERTETTHRMGIFLFVVPQISRLLYAMFLPTLYHSCCSAVVRTPSPRSDAIPPWLKTSCCDLSSPLDFFADHIEKPRSRPRKWNGRAISGKLEELKQNIFQTCSLAKSEIIIHDAKPRTCRVLEYAQCCKPNK